MPHSLWNLPGPGIEPTSPALAGGFLTTGPPGRSFRFSGAWKLPPSLQPTWSLTQNKWNRSGRCSRGQKRTEKETVCDQTLSLVPGWGGCGQGVPSAGGRGQDEQPAPSDSERCRWGEDGSPCASLPSSPHRMDPTAYAELLKESGNQGFKSGNFSLAIRKYDEAIQILLQLYQWG